MKDFTIGYAFCGSFCTIKESVNVLKQLAASDVKIKPIMSPIVYSTDTRFNKADDLIKEVEGICGESVMHDITDVEPIGPKNLLDVMVVSPCTGNTMAKIALGITDTSVTMAVKAHLRNNKPVILAIATNDALGTSAKNMGLLHNTRNVYFVPYRQDDPFGKNNSLISDFSLIPQTIEAALKGEQLQPIMLPSEKK